MIDISKTPFVLLSGRTLIYLILWKAFQESPHLTTGARWRFQMNGSSEKKGKCWNTSKMYFWVRCLDWDDILGAESSSSFGCNLFINPSSEEWNICVNSIQSLLDMVEVRPMQFVQFWSLIGTSCIHNNSHKTVREAVNEKCFFSVVQWWKMAFTAHLKIIIVLWTIIGTLLLQVIKMAFLTSSNPNVSAKCVAAGEGKGSLLLTTFPKQPHHKCIIKAVQVQVPLHIHIPKNVVQDWNYPCTSIYPK